MEPTQKNDLNVIKGVVAICLTVLIILLIGVPANVSYEERIEDLKDQVVTKITECVKEGRDDCQLQDLEEEFARLVDHDEASTASEYSKYILANIAQAMEQYGDSDDS